MHILTHAYARTYLYSYMYILKHTHAHIYIYSYLGDPSISNYDHLESKETSNVKEYYNQWKFSAAAMELGVKDLYNVQPVLFTLVSCGIVVGDRPVLFIVCYLGYVYIYILFNSI